MKNKTAGRWQMVLLIVCICFFVGILTGAVSAGALKQEQVDRLNGYMEAFASQETSFWPLFFKHGKYIGAIWLAGFISSGAVIVLIIIFCSGIFYGFSASFAAAGAGLSYVLANILPQNIILIPLYIFAAVWTINFVLNKFSNNGPKSRIKRERQKHLSEHLIILLCCLAINAAACLSEAYVVDFIAGFLK